jgi:hypothetical protein
MSAAAGCGGAKLYPVGGKATVNGKPLSRVIIEFNPDPDKGWETTRFSCTGQVGGDGRYSLTTDDGFKQAEGARAGWYRVTVAPPPNASYTDPLPVHKKYADFTKTDMMVEVLPAAAPGAYDLNFAEPAKGANAPTKPAPGSKNLGKPPVPGA